MLSVIKTGGTSQSFAYDAYGDLTGNAETGAAVTAMTYDLGLKLTAIDAAGTANDATFTFDAIGRFRTRVLAGSTDTYSYVGAGETVTRIANSVGGNTDSIVSPTGDRLGVKVGATLNWFLPDPHGNIAASLDSAETTVVNAIRYDAYGQTILTGSAGGSPVGQGSWKYQGRLDISPSGLGTPLYDLSARFYSPGLGAFSQLDSVMGGAQDPLSMNRFLYAQANPATLIDPTGHQACGPGGIYCDTARDLQPIQKTQPYKLSKQVEAYRANRARVAAWRTRISLHQDDEREANRVAMSSQMATNRTMAMAAQPNNDGDLLGGFVSGLWNGTVGGVINLAGHVLTNLDKIPKGLDVLVNHPRESIAAIGDASGLSDPGGNIGRGWDAMLTMSAHDKVEFWTSIVAGAVVGVKGPKLPGARGGGAEAGASRLSEVSQAAFKAAEDPASIFVKNKHLPSAGGSHAKFISNDVGEVQSWIAEGLRSDGAQFLPNQLDGTFRAVVPGGRVVGTRGQTNIRVIVTDDGRVINAFPVQVR